MNYTPQDWYWIVNGDQSQVYSSAVGSFVAATDPAYAAWLTAGNAPTNIDSTASLGAVLAPYRLRPVDPSVLAGYIAALSLTSLEFRQLFTAAERTAITTAGQSVPAIREFMDDESAAGTVNLTNPEVVAGVAALVGAGLLTQDRANQILADIAPPSS